MASGSLVQSQWTFLNVIGIRKCFGGIVIRASGHKQISSVNVDAWIFWLEDNQLLKVHEGEPSVSDQVRAFSSVQIGIKHVLVQINCYAQVSDSFFEHT